MSHDGEPGDTLIGPRRAVVEQLPLLARLTPGETGNLSVREGDRFAITPTGMAYDRIDPADVPVMDLNGNRVAGDREPSSEVAMHSGIYRGLDAGAVAHTHSPWATTLAVAGLEVPPVHYMIALAGTEVPLASYATYGTRELAMNVAEAMMDADSGACLIANHGVVATGADAADAMATAQAVESVAQLYCQARMLGVEPDLLPEEELKRVARKFESYGQ